MWEFHDIQSEKKVSRGTKSPEATFFSFSLINGSERKKKKRRMASKKHK